MFLPQERIKSRGWMSVTTAALRWTPSPPLCSPISAPRTSFAVWCVQEQWGFSRHKPHALESRRYTFLCRGALLRPTLDCVFLMWCITRRRMHYVGWIHKGHTRINRRTACVYIASRHNADDDEMRIWPAKPEQTASHPSLIPVMSHFKPTKENAWERKLNHQVKKHATVLKPQNSQGPESSQLIVCHDGNLVLLIIHSTIWGMHNQS